MLSLHFLVLLLSVFHVTWLDKSSDALSLAMTPPNAVMIWNQWPELPRNHCAPTVDNIPVRATLFPELSLAVYCHAPHAAGKAVELPAFFVVNVSE